MRRGVIGCAILAVALGLAACGDDDSGTTTASTEPTTATSGATATTAAAAEANDIPALPPAIAGTEIETLLLETKADAEYTLGFAIPNRADPNWQLIIKKGEEYAEALGVTLRVVDPGGYEAGPRQADQMDELVQAGVDGIVLGAADAAALGPAVARAADAGVPTVTFLTGESSGRAVSSVSNNLVDIGRKACENIVAGVPGAKVVMLSGPQGAEAASLRAQGFKECAEAAGLEILAERFGPSSRDDALTQMENLLQSFGDEVGAIYTFGSYMALGAADAVQRAGIESGKIFISTTNPEAETVKRLQSGEIGGAVDQFIGIIADAAIATLVQHLNGEEIEKRIEVPVDSVLSSESKEKDWSWTADA